MYTDQELQDKLAQPIAPSDLEKKIRGNWKQQLAQQTPPKNKSPNNRWRLLVAGVALFVLALFLFKLLNETPGFVTAALNDISKDKIKKVGLSMQPKKWLNAHKIKMPPSSLSIKIAKYCVLAGSKTLHLKIAGKQFGNVHLFVLAGQFDSTFWKNQQGTSASMPWQLIQPSDHLSVLVMHTQNTNKENIQKLIQTMFYA